MLRKIILFFLASVTIGQVAVSVAAMSWLNSTIEVEQVEYFIERSSRNDILVDNQNQLWASYTSHIDIYQNGQFVRKFKSDEIGSQPDMLALGPQGEVWNIPGGISGGMSMFDGQSWTFVNGIEDEFASDAAVDRQGRVWLAAATAVYFYENGKWHKFDTSNSNIITDGANTITVDANDRIWIGTEKGVAYFDGQNWQTPPGSPAVSVYSLAFAPNGNLWMGSFSDGLFHFEGTTWTRYPVKTNTKSPERYEAVEAILTDKHGRVWVHVATDQFYIFDGQSKKYLGRGPTDQVWNMFIAPDGFVYIDDSDKVYIVSQDTRLLDKFEYSMKNLYDDGFIVFTTLFLACVWILTAIQTWGMGAGIALGLATYIVAAFFDLHGYLNPGFTTTLTAFTGGMFGYFLKGSKTQRSAVIGSLVGYFSGVLIVSCCFGAVVLFALMGR
jgi:hypothetical protein